MKRNTLNFVVDAATALVMSGMVATGMIIRFVLPPGSGGQRALWGLGRHDWGDLHFWLAVALAVLVIVHVALHWQWVCTTALRLFRNGKAQPEAVDRTGGNLTGFILLVLIVGTFAGFVWLARISVQEVRGGRQQGEEKHSQPAESDAFVRGSLTLAETAATVNISVETLRQRLGLPASVSAGERLGQICRDKGIPMSEARKLILTPPVSGEPQTK